MDAVACSSSSASAAVCSITFGSCDYDRYKSLIEELNIRK